MIERQEAGHELVWSWSKCGRDRGVIWTIGGVFIVSHWRFSIAIMLGPCPNTCFAHDRKGLSSGTLMIRTQTLTLTRDWARDC